MTWSGTGIGAKLTCRIGPTPAYSCAPGATRNGSQCTTTQSASVSYSCPSGGTPNGNQCTSTSSQAASVAYSCSAGTLSGNQCLSSSTYGGTVTGYSCRAGDSLSGSTCTHTAGSTYGGTPTGYSCSAGDSLSGSTCTHVSSTTYAATASSYSCNAGDPAPSGSTCTHTTTSNPNTIYSCASGTLSGQQCLGATRRTAYVYLGAKQIAETSEGVTQYVHTDALGSPVAHTNSTGAVLNRSRFEPYGYVAQGTKPSPGTSVIGFTGHVQDAETDLVYMQQRYYDPIAGRFLSVDPIVTDANTGKGFGLYTYVDNNPYAKIDPDGRNAIAAPEAFIGGTLVCGPACGIVAGGVVLIGGTYLTAKIFNSISNSGGDKAQSGNGNGNSGGGEKGNKSDQPAPPVDGATGGERFGGGPRIWDKPSSNPVDQANGDFDKKFPGGENVSDKGNGVRVGTNPDGSRVIVRPGSSAGSGNVPTVEIQNPRGKPTDKIRYPQKPESDK